MARRASRSTADRRGRPDETGQKVLRAIDVRTGAIAWELPQTGPGSSWGGTLATAGGLVFFGEDSGALMAVDAATGAPLWQFQTNAQWKASPMTYVFDGRQHIARRGGPEHHGVQAASSERSARAAATTSRDGRLLGARCGSSATRGRSR